ncbi:MAG TPA: hypothetical protein DCM05_07180, partial [Elusimicrobia bacterium]|nr:hypothetical protein [Elusimicrobiota bacterium]
MRAWSTAPATPGEGLVAQLHFVQRFGESLNLHVHTHAVVSEGVFRAGRDFFGRPRLSFKPCFGPNEVETRVLEERIRRRILRRFVRMGAMPAETAEEMLLWEN